MALTIGDNFSYMGAKPLDGRLKYDTVASMAAMADSVLYDGCLAYCVATGKTYQWKSTNDVDATLGRWREFESGGGEITVDDELSHVSENPVQNKVIAEALDEKADLVSGKVPATQLPSYVDDVIEGYYNGTDGKFYEESTYETEIVGEAGKIYLSLDTNFEYRWTGSAFARVNEGVVLGETSSTAYRGDRGKIAYDDSQANKVAIGDLTELDTSEKTNLVGAINEVGRGVSIQKAEMPVPTSALLNTIVEYVGETDANFTNGYFYKCKAHIVDTTIPDFYPPIGYEDPGRWYSPIYSYDIDYNIDLYYYQPNIYIDGVEVAGYGSGGENTHWTGYLPAGSTLQFHGGVNRYVKDINLHHEDYYWEQIAVQSVDEMPAEDMSEVANPMPSVMSRRFKYSTEEQVVGEWIDGKPIYQKTYALTNIAVAANAEVAIVDLSTLGVETFVEIHALGKENNRWFDFSRANGGLRTLDDNKLYVGGASAWSFSNFNVTLKYTKTTD